jgi:hypothetical protein
VAFWVHFVFVIRFKTRLKALVQAAKIQVVIRIYSDGVWQHNHECYGNPCRVLYIFHWQFSGLTRYNGATLGELLPEPVGILR